MATSKLQIEVGDLLDRTFPEYRIRENYRPDWLMSSNLTKLELDFYIEELKIAIEVQGKQHYEFIPFFFPTISDFEKRKQYDSEKRDLCYGAGVRLIEIDSLFDAKLEIDKIKGTRKEYPKEWLAIRSAEIQKLREREREIRESNLIMDEIKRNLKIIKIETGKDEITKRKKKLIYKETYLKSPVRKLINVFRNYVPNNGLPENTEVLQFCAKLQNFCENGGNVNGEAFCFLFTCLDKDKREILLDGLRAVHIRYE